MTDINLEKRYKEKIRPQAMKEEKLKNIHSATFLDKVVINVGVGKIASSRRSSAGSKKTEQDLVEDIENMLKIMSGQRPKIVIARKSIAGFKLRAGNVVGMTTTLRGRRMYDFLGRFIFSALPRSHDFRGIPIKSVDKAGNLTIGISDMSVFPELAGSMLSFGCEVTLAVKAKDRERAISFYKGLGIPFSKNN